MVERAIAAMLCGFGGSCALYDLLHQPQAPELSRYGVGCLLIVVGAYILFGEDFAIKTLAVVSLVGSGVALNRLRMALQ